MLFHQGMQSNGNNNGEQFIWYQNPNRIYKNTMNLWKCYFDFGFSRYWAFDDGKMRDRDMI